MDSIVSQKDVEWAFSRTICEGECGDYWFWSGLIPCITIVENVDA